MKKKLFYVIGIVLNVVIVTQCYALYSSEMKKPKETIPAIQVINPTKTVELVRPKPRPNSIQVKCLALNIYHEARGEPDDGQRKVGFVTLNRVKHKRWKDSICDVVYEPYQFSWTLANPKIDFSNDVSRKSYEKAYFMATKIIYGLVDDNSGGANHYYAFNKVNPSWADKMTVVATVGEHIFLR